MNPELKAKEDQEFRNSEIGAVEVESDTPDRISEQTKQDLYELPNGLRTAFERVAPGLGAEVYSRAQELAGDLLRQLQDSQQRGNASEYGSFNDNTTVSAERESMNFGQINTMVAALEILADQLAEQARRQPADEKIIDLDKLDGGEERAVPEFWYLLTGQREFGAGNEVQVGPYSLSTQQSQEAQGPGSETRKLVIRKMDTSSGDNTSKNNVVSMEDYRQKRIGDAGSVVAAEEVAEEIPAVDNVTYIEDFKRNKPERRFEENAENSPGEQSRAAS